MMTASYATSAAPIATTATAATTTADSTTMANVPTAAVIVALAAAATTAAISATNAATPFRQRSLHHQQIFSYDDSWFYWFPAFVVISPGPLKLDKYV